MRAGDYWRWIGHELKDAKGFASLNIAAVAINACIAIVFFALIFGVEQAAIARIAEEVDLFTLQTSSGSQRALTLGELSFAQADPRVKHIAPVLSSFAELQIGGGAPGGEDSSGVGVYAENIFFADPGRSDPRLSSLRFLRGNGIDAGSDAGIVISAIMFQRLAADRPALSLEDIGDAPCALTVNRYVNRVKESSTFSCRIAGVAQSTPHDGVLIYLATPLAARIDDWSRFQGAAPADIGTRPVERVDIVANDLQQLEQLRVLLQQRGYKTSSILDRIDNVRQILTMFRVVFVFVFGLSSTAIAMLNLGITLASSVLKRRQEIGILKALGATDGQVWALFMAQALVVGALGSIAGVCLASVIIFAAQQLLAASGLVPGMDLFRLDLSLVLGIVSAALVTSGVAAWLPARQGAALDPADALRIG